MILRQVKHCELLSLASFVTYSTQTFLTNRTCCKFMQSHSKGKNCAGAKDELQRAAQQQVKSTCFAPAFPGTATQDNYMLIFTIKLMFSEPILETDTIKSLHAFTWQVINTEDN